MNNYVKYTAADGTVHLCHANSPTLIHANKSLVIGEGGKTTKVAWNIFQASWDNLMKLCTDNKIDYAMSKSGPPYALNLGIQYKDNNGKMHSRDFKKIEISHYPYRDYSVFINDQAFRDNLDKDVASINDAMLSIKEELKKYKMTSKGYYKTK